MSLILIAGLIPGPLGGGFGQMGVGIFYILSAFLLTTLYAGREFTRGARYDYLVRRAARVLPLFYAALLLSLVVEGLTGISVYKAFDSVERTLGNVLLIQGTSVLWSIPVEIQFYLIFLGFWGLLPYGIVPAFGFLITVQAILLVFAQEFGIRVTSLPYWMHFFTIGCAFGVVASRPGWANRIARSSIFRVLVLVAVAGTVLVLPSVRRIYLGLTPWENFIDPFTVGWIVTISAAFVFGLVHRRWVNNALIITMGELSFSVYLLHKFLILAVSELVETDLILPYDRFLIVVAGTYALSMLVTRGFERPAQKLILGSLLSRTAKFG